MLSRGVIAEFLRYRPAVPLRRVAVVASAATALGTAALMMSPMGPSMVLPGPLKSFHAPLAQDCTACHVASSTAVLSVFHGMAATELSFVQSGKCLGCHRLGDYPLLVHGWSPSTLELARNNAEGEPTLFEASISPAMVSEARVPIAAGGELACSTCHHEHRGRNSSLTALTEQQCQVCHARSFGNFGSGHPEFTSFPYLRRTRLVFDHRKHIGKHFVAPATRSAAPRSCLGCHAPDPSGDHLTVRDFERSCAGCHADQIRGAGQVDAKGIAFLTLPSLDIETLRSRGVDVGTWQADAAYSETPMTGFMQALLVGASSRADDLRSIGALDLLDLSSADDEELAAVGRVAWAIKELFFSVVSGGHDVLQARINSAVAEPLAARALPSLLAEIPRELIGGAVDAWLPCLAGELDRHRVGQTSSADEKCARPPASDFSKDGLHEAWVGQGGWYRQDLDYSIRYRPVGHADPFLRAWLELSSVVAGSAGSGALASIFETLAQPTSVGVCVKCHSVEAGESGGLRVNWAPAPSLLPADGLDRFSHATHFPAVGERGCLTCHSLDATGRDYLDAFESSDPTSFTPNFAPMTTSTCASCHSSGRVSENCLTCHTYHSGNAASAHIHAPLTEPVLKAEVEHEAHL